MNLSRLARGAAATCITTATLLTAGCAGEPGSADAAQAQGAAKVRTLTLGAYTTPREVYGQKIIPAFQKFWKDKTGEEVRFEESYLGSGAQARAIREGFEADVAALSLDPDIQLLENAGLITHDWRARARGGMISRSVVVIGVRPGNPKGIRTWQDLARPDVDVLTPSPRTSGGAMWNIAAVYGAGQRGGDAATAEALLGRVLRRVKVMDKGARESLLTFESGIGDAIITYENEVLVARKAGEEMDYVIPASTILIENPAAVVDKYADAHGNRDVAEAFVEFLITPEVQRMFAEYGLRPVDERVASEAAAAFPPVAGLFTIRDLGGWPVATETLFASGAAFDRAYSSLASRR